VLRQICSLLEPQPQRETHRSSPFPPHVQVLTNLGFLATGTFQREIGYRCVPVLCESCTPLGHQNSHQFITHGTSNSNTPLSNKYKLRGTFKHGWTAKPNWRLFWHAAFCTILPWTGVSNYLNKPRQTTCQKTPSKCHHDEATTDCMASVAVIKRPVMARVVFFLLGHFHIKLFFLFFGDITNYRWHGINSTCNFFPDFPFWISESRTSISEPIKLFFLRLDAILMT